MLILPKIRRRKRMKIYTEEILLHILKKPKAITGEGIYLKVKSADEIIEIYDKVKTGKMSGVRAYYFEPSNYKKIVADFKQNFDVIEAGGGIVQKEDKILFIKRLGKWDLPKGKFEKGEKKREGALREVEEECNIQVEIIEKVGVTWHTFLRSGKNRLKKTHWYSMRCLDDSEMSPQFEEGIDEVQWFEKNEIKSVALNHTYNTIRKIYRKYLKQKNKAENQESVTVTAQNSAPILEN